MEFEIEQRVEHKVSGKRGEITDYGKTRAPTYVVKWDDGSTTTVAGPVVRRLPMVAEKSPLNPPKGEQSKFFRHRKGVSTYRREPPAQAKLKFVRDPNYTMTLRDWWRKPEKMNREHVKMDPKVVMGPELLDPWRRAR